MFDKYLDEVYAEQTRIGQIYESIFGESLSLDEGWSKAGLGAVIGGGVGGYIGGRRHGVLGSYAGSSAGAALGARKGKEKAVAWGAAKGRFLGSLGGAAIGGLGGAAVGGILGANSSIGGGMGAGLGAIGGAALGSGIGGMIGTYKGAKAADEEPDDNDVEDDPKPSKKQKAKAIKQKPVEEPDEELDEGLSKAITGGLLGSLIGGTAGYVAGEKYGEHFGSNITSQMDDAANRTIDAANKGIDATASSVDSGIVDVTKSLQGSAGRAIGDIGNNAAEGARGFISQVGTDASNQLRQASDQLQTQIVSNADNIGDNITRNLQTGMTPPPPTGNTHNIEKANASLIDTYKNKVNKMQGSASGLVGKYLAPSVGSTVSNTLKTDIPKHIALATDTAANGITDLADTTALRAYNSIQQQSASAADVVNREIGNAGNAVRQNAQTQLNNLKPHVKEIIQTANDSYKPIVTDTAKSFGKLTGAGIGASAGGLVGAAVGSSMQDDSENNKKRKKH